MPCSFCKSTNHNIKKCADPNIYNLYRKIIEIYTNIIISQYENILERFILMISIEFNVKELRSVVSRFLKLNSNLTKLNLIKKLYENFSTPNQVDEQDAIDITMIDYIPILERRPERRRSIVGLGLNNYLFRETGYPEDPEKYNIKLICTDYINDNFNDNFNDNSIKNYYDKECAICLETECVYNLVKLNCGHEFCGQCITQVLKTNKNKKSINCALCRDKVNTIDVNSFKVYDLMVNNCIL